MQIPRPRTLIIGLSIAACGVLLLPWFQGDSQKTGSSLVAQDLGPLNKARETILEGGVLVPAEEAVIKSLVASRIQRILVQDGTAVKQGDLLLQLNDLDQRVQLNELMVEMAAVEGALARTKSEQEFLDSQKELAQKVAKARKQAVDAKSLAVNEATRNEPIPDIVRTANRAEAELAVLEVEFENRRMLRELQRAVIETAAERAQAELQRRQLLTRIEQTERAIKACAITAPRDGVFLLVTTGARRTATATLESGAEVRAQQTLGRVVSTDRLKMSVKVNETRIAQVKQGQLVEIVLDALPDRKFTGKVQSVAQTPSPVNFPNNNRADYEVIVALEQLSTLLRPGMTGAAEIRVD